MNKVVVPITATFEEQIRELHELAKTGGPGNNGGMDAWQASVESRLKQLHEDLRHNLFWTIAGFAAVLGVLAKGFHWI